MKIIVNRSFQRTKQIANYEPIVSQCSLSVELDTKLFSAAKVEQVSKSLSEIAVREVEATIAREINKRRTVDEGKIADTAKTEAELDAGINDFEDK